MKTVKTFFALLLIAGISGTAFAQNGALDKLKDAAKKNKDNKKVSIKNKKGKGDKIAVKGSGVPTKNTSAETPAKETPAATNK